MKMFLLIFTALTFLNVGCADGGGSKKDATPAEEQTKSITSEADCSGGIPAHSPQGRWLHQMEGSQIRFDMIFEITGSRIHLTNQCTIRGHRLTASVSSSITQYPDRIRIWEKVQDSEEYDDGNFQANCNVSLEASELPYELEGRCLVFVQGNERFYLKPY